VGAMHLRLRLAAVAIVAATLPACRTTEVALPIPGRTDDMGRALRLSTPDRDWGYEVEAAALAGGGPAGGERLALGVRVSERADVAFAGRAETHAVVEARPVAVPVGTVRWPRGALGYETGSGADADDVAVEWMVGVTRRGPCTVEVELVPRLVASCAPPVLLECLRLRRIVERGEAVVVAADPAAGASREASLLVGKPPGSAGRFAIRVR
jgi:hypothetical protein